MIPWAEKIEKESGGRIKIEIYPAMQLGGKPPALFDQIRDGVIDGGWAIPAYTPGRFPGSEAFELPFMTSMSAEASRHGRMGFHRKIYGRAVFRCASVGLSMWHGPGVIHKKGDPIATIADFNGFEAARTFASGQQTARSCGCYACWHAGSSLSRSAVQRHRWMAA